MNNKTFDELTSTEKKKYVDLLKDRARNGDEGAKELYKILYPKIQLNLDIL